MIWNLKKKLLKTMKNHGIFFLEIIKFMKTQNISIFKAYILSMNLIVNLCIIFLFLKIKKYSFFQRKKSDKSKISVYGSIGPQTNIVISVYVSNGPINKNNR